MQKIFLLPTLVCLALATSAQAAVVNFSYTQADSTTGAGTISPFSFSGHDFTATPMPAATVFNPVPASTPIGYVGAQNVASGSANEANTAVGLLFSGTVNAISTDGWTITIPLLFVSKQTQVPDANDYTWNIAYGDSPVNGQDAVGASLRFAAWLSRDNTIDAAETPNTFQRYTQQTQSFVAGQDNFSNLDTTTAAIKDATDSGAPAGTDAAGRDLAFYFGWRDGGSLSSGAILVDTFTVGGLLNADEGSLQMVPEPSIMALVGLGGFASLLLLRRKK
jgi:hypothetical protein